VRVIEKGVLREGLGTKKKKATGSWRENGIIWSFVICNLHHFKKVEMGCTFSIHAIGTQ
jgi:hypothetical protein